MENNRKEELEYIFSIIDDKSYYRDLMRLINKGLSLSYSELRYNGNYQKSYETFAIETLSNIFLHGNYSNFTETNNIRYLIQQISREKIINFICNYLEEFGRGSISEYVHKFGNEFYIYESDIEKLLKQYIDVSNYTVNVELLEEFFKTPSVKKAQNIVYNTPSNKLRDAILNDTQTKLNTSSFLGQGMYAYSDVGRKRTNQEDSYYIGSHPKNPDFKILIVADGMGGHNNGEKASNIIVSELLRWFENLPPEEFYNQNSYNLEMKLRQKVNEINQEVYQSTNGGGSTLCLSILKQDSILMGNIGDSQGYVVENDRLIYTTVPENLPTKKGVPSEFVRFHSDSNKILQHIGSERLPELHVDYISLQPNNSYRVILCSDGVTDCLSEPFLIDIATTTDSPAQALVQIAVYEDSTLQEELQKLSEIEQQQIMQDYGSKLKNSIMGGKDNTTAVVADIPRRRR